MKSIKTMETHENCEPTQTPHRHGNLTGFISVIFQLKRLKQTNNSTAGWRVYFETKQILMCLRLRCVVK